MRYPCTTKKYALVHIFYNGQVCDEACGTGLHGDYNCNWRELGAKCRSCFDDVDAALKADEVAKRHGGRVIMCDTYVPFPCVVLGIPANVQKKYYALPLYKFTNHFDSWTQIICRS